MKVLRIVLLLGVLLGSSILIVEQSSVPPDTLPFPGPGQWVRFPFAPHLSGTYYAKVVMPTVGESVDLAEETLACQVSIDISMDASVVHQQQATTITRTGQLGFWHTDEYQAGDRFKLPSGKYTVRFSGSGPCPAAIQRGAVITLEEDVGEPTSHYLMLQIRHGLALLLIFGGGAALVLLEIVRRHDHTRRRSRP